MLVLFYHLQEVCFLDTNGFTSVGYLRVSRVVRKPAREDDNESDNAESTNGQCAKKSKKGSDSDSGAENKPSSTAEGALALQSLQKSISSDSCGDQAAISSSSSTLPTPTVAPTAPTTVPDGADTKSSGKYTNGSTGSDANTSEDSNKPRAPEEDEGEQEYVCVIRPADASVPPGSSVCFQTYLSTASMVEHDRKKREDTHAATIGRTENARGSPSCSVSNDSGSNDSGSDDKRSNNKVSTTTGTSSETGSEEGSA